MPVNSSLLSKYNSRFVRHYNLYSRLLLRSNEKVDFMNLGYIGELPFTLKESDRAFERAIALYTKVLEGMRPEVVNSLEVGSGLGGGGYLLKNYYGVANVLGVDYGKQNVKYSNSKYKGDGIEYLRYSSDNINELDRTFDLILSVEASQHFDDWELFISNINQLLDTDGRFHYADMFMNDDQEKIEQIIAKSGLEIELTDDITEGVVQSIALMQPPKKSWTYKLICTVLNLNGLEEFEAYDGSYLHQLLTDRSLRYMKYIIKKS